MTRSMWRMRRAASISAAIAGSLASQVGVQPGACGDVHLALARQFEQLGHVGDAVGAQTVGDARQQIEVGCESVRVRVGPLSGLWSRWKPL